MLIFFLNLEFKIGPYNIWSEDNRSNRILIILINSFETMVMHSWYSQRYVKINSDIFIYYLLQLINQISWVTQIWRFSIKSHQWLNYFLPSPIFWLHWIWTSPKNRRWWHFLSPQFFSKLLYFRLSIKIPFNYQKFSKKKK